MNNIQLSGERQEYKRRRTFIFLSLLITGSSHTKLF
jgi:hypothetical protein